MISRVCVCVFEIEKEIEIFHLQFWYSYEGGNANKEAGDGYAC